MSTFRKLCADDDFKQWDRIIDNSHYGSIFHSTIWQSSLLRTPQPPILGMFDDDTLIAGCPIITHFHCLLFTTATTTPPLTPYGGLVIKQLNNASIRNQEQHNTSIVTQFSKYIKKQGFEYIRIDLPPACVDIRPFTVNRWGARVYYTYMADLTKPISHPLSKNAYRSIQNAKKSNITITRVSPDSIGLWIDKYIKLFENTYMNHKIKPPFSNEHMEKIILDVYAHKIGELWIATDDTDILIAAELIIFDGQCVHRFSPASQKTNTHKGVVSLLLFEIMKHLRGFGFDRFNLMAANTPSLAFFIASFNPMLIPHYTVEIYSSMYEIARSIKHLSRI